MSGDISMESGQGSSSVSLRHEIRITSQGKIKNWVTYALDFFEKEPDTPLVLHTLPSSRPPQQEVGTATAEDPKKPDTTDEAKTPKKQKLPSSTATIPRLISVAEIIKREYLKKLDPANSDTGSLYGLHQYNEIGHLEEAEPSADDEEDLDDVRQREITLKLQGKNHLRMRRIAYMKITLARNEVPSLATTGVTHQKPASRKLSKSARTRLKRRLQKESSGG